MNAGRPRTRKRYVHPIFSQLRDERRKRKITIEKLTEMSGLGDDCIGEWERGERMPQTIERLEHWCNTLGFELFIRRIDDVGTKEAAENTERLIRERRGEHQLQSKTRSG